MPVLLAYATGRAVQAPANAAPSDVALTNSTVLNTAAAGTVIGTFSVTDPDDVSWGWSINNAKFQLSASTGATVDLQRSGTGTLTPGVAESVTVTVTDSFSNQYPETFLIAVADAASETLLTPVTVTSTTGGTHLVEIGLPLAADALPAGTTLSVKDGATPLSVQIDNRSSDLGGRVRFVALSFLPTFSAPGQTKTFNIYRTTGADPTGTAVSAGAILGTSYDVTVELTIGGQIYRASARTGLGASTTYANKDTAWNAGTWRQGPRVTEHVVTAPLVRVSDSAVHASMRAWFHIAAHQGLSSIATDVVLENGCWQDVAGIGDVTYDAVIKVESSTAASHSSITHFPRARWHQKVWWGAALTYKALFGTHANAVAPTTRAHADYMVSTRCYLNYNQTFGNISHNMTELNKITKPMMQNVGGNGKSGDILLFMRSEGDRDDLGVMPQWDVEALIRPDANGMQKIFKNADCGAQQGIHFRRSGTGLVCLVNEGTDYTQPSNGSTAQGFTTEGAHLPSLAYNAYLHSGSFFYFEEMMFQVNQFWMRTPVSYNGRQFHRHVWGDQEARGHAWLGRDFAQYVLLVPDSKKSCFSQRKDHVQAWLINAFTDNVYRYINDTVHFSTAPGPRYTATSNDEFAPWQVYYIISALAHQYELGMLNSDGLQFYAWMSQWVVEAFTNTAACVPLYTAFEYWIKVKNGSGIWMKDTASMYAYYRTYTVNHIQPGAYPAAPSTQQPSPLFSDQNYVRLGRMAARCGGGQNIIAGMDAALTWVEDITASFGLSDSNKYRITTRSAGPAPSFATLQRVVAANSRFYSAGQPWFPTTHFLLNNPNSSHVYFSTQLSTGDRTQIRNDLVAGGYNSIYLYLINEGDYGGKSLSPYASGIIGGAFDDARIASWRSEMQTMIGLGLRPILWLFPDDSPTIAGASNAELKRYIARMVEAFDDLPILWVLGLEIDEYWSKSVSDDLGSYLKSLTINPVGVHQLQGQTSYMTSTWVDFAAYQEGFTGDWIAIYNSAVAKLAVFRDADGKATKPLLFAEYEIGATAASPQEGLAAAFAGCAGVGNGAPAGLAAFMAGLPSNMVSARSGNTITLTGSGKVATANLLTLAFSVT